MDNGSEMLRNYLAERDEPCPGCGYNLRGLTGGRCPECNQDLCLRVGLVEQRLAWFIFGVVGIGMSLGFCTLLLAWAASMLVRVSGGPQMWDILLLAVGAIVACAMMWWWLGARRRFASSTEQSRWGLAILVTVIGLVFPIWFMATVN
jgi:hypothetical protein